MSAAAMTLAVTGATGQLGRRVLESLRLMAPAGTRIVGLRARTVAAGRRSDRRSAPRRLHRRRKGCRQRWPASTACCWCPSKATTTCACAPMPRPPRPRTARGCSASSTPASSTSTRRRRRSSRAYTAKARRRSARQAATARCCATARTRRTWFCALPPRHAKAAFFACPRAMLACPSSAATTWRRRRPARCSATCPGRPPGGSLAPSCWAWKRCATWWAARSTCPCDTNRWRTLEYLQELVAQGLSPDLCQRRLAYVQAMRMGFMTALSGDFERLVGRAPQAMHALIPTLDLSPGQRLH